MADKVHESITCPICLGLLCEAVESSCGHCFCASCIIEYRETTGKIACPVCRKPAGLIHPSFALRQLISALQGAKISDPDDAVKFLMDKEVLVDLPDVYSDPASPDKLEKISRFSVRIPFTEEVYGGHFDPAFPPELRETGMAVDDFNATISELNQIIDRNLPGGRTWGCCLCFCCCTILLCGPCWLMSKHSTAQRRVQEHLSSSVVLNRFGKDVDAVYSFGWRLVGNDAQQMFPSRDSHWIEVDVIPRLLLA